MSTPTSIADLFRNTPNPRRLRWTEAEVIQWVWSQPRWRRDEIVAEMHQMRAEGQTNHQIYLTLHEARRVVEEEGLGRASAGKWMSTLYNMFAYWQHTKAQMNVGDAMDNLANLDMEKFGK